MSQGVRQGGILSTDLFKNYGNVFFDILVKTGRAISARFAVLLQPARMTCLCSLTLEKPFSFC